MASSEGPSVTPLRFGSVQLPLTHPRAAEEVGVLLGFAIHHPDGVILVDTGSRAGHPIIDEIYAPDVVGVIDALNSRSIDERDVVAIVNTHLHFDHCGQNDSLPGVPVWVRPEEVEAARTEGYTVPEWAAIPPDRLRLAADDEAIASGVRLVATPGHTPGHQSVVITGRDGRHHVVAGQCCHSRREWVAGTPEATDMHDPGLVSAGRDSLRRLRALNPVAVFFSHDPDPYLTPNP